MFAHIILKSFDDLTIWKQGNLRFQSHVAAVRNRSSAFELPVIP